MLRLIPFFVFAGMLAAQADDLVVPEQPTTLPASPKPFTMGERFKWAAVSAVSPRRSAGYLISSALSTAGNSPEEYGPHWDGFGKRLAIRASTGATGLMLEAGIGGLWGEDPRYVRAPERPVKARLFNVVKMTFVARNRQGETVPAYARYIAIPANSFISNAWRADSHATVDKAMMRLPLSLLDRIIANFFSEFWPEISKPLRRGK